MCVAQAGRERVQVPPGGPMGGVMGVELKGRLTALEKRVRVLEKGLSLLVTDFQYVVYGSVSPPGEALLHVERLLAKEDKKEPAE